MFFYQVGFGSGSTVCPGSSDPAEKKTFNIFASENEVYTIF